MEGPCSASHHPPCTLLSVSQLAELCQCLSSPPSACLRQLASAAAAGERLSGVRVWSALLQALSDRSDRLVLLTRCPLLVPPLLDRLVLEAGRDDASSEEVALLFSVAADVLRVAAPLAGYVNEAVLQSAHEPWRCLLSGRRRQKRRRCDGDATELLSNLLTVAIHLPGTVRRKWRLSSLVARLRQMSVERNCEEVCWLGSRLVATVAGMSGSQWKCWLNVLRISPLSDIVNADRYFPATRLSRFVLSSSENDASSSIEPLLSSSHTDERLVCVEGVFLPVVDPVIRRQQQKSTLVSVPSLRRSLRVAALALATGRPLLLEGPVGCGKSTLARHLAHLTGRDRFPRLVTVQMTEQIDSKLFLGQYRCTEVPGQFVWRDGCLVAAMQAGDWLLLEDIDAAPADVLALLLPVLERGLLPGALHGHTVRAAPGFRLLATQRLESGPSSQLHRRRPLQLAGSEQLWTVVSMEPLSSAELQSVLVTRWPRLAPVADRLLQVFQTVTVRGDGERQGVRETRLVSTRDLMKWCGRFGKCYDDSSAECAYSVFQHACDLFCSALSSDEMRLARAQEIAVYLGIAPDQVTFLLTQHKPSVSNQGSTLTVGRCQLLKSPENDGRSRASPVARFSLTRPASLLLERIAVAVNHSEPLLLVGETGVGKTSAVQILATRTGHHLLVINLSQQSDSTDLLGGHKPVGVKQVMTPVRLTFEQLFRQTFDSTANAKFLHHVTVLFAAERWADLCDLILQVQKKAAIRLKQKMPSDSVDSLLKEWISLSDRVSQLRLSIKKDMALAFAFIEGALVEALRKGWWVLLDEINLASDDALSCVAGVLDSETLTFLESGDARSVRRHPSFRLFSCMNPATDVGKHQLPAGLRNRFTELFVDELENETDLCLLIGDYLHHLGVASAQINGVVQLYQTVRREARDSLVDGTGNRPHYSLRTLCRALTIAAANPCGRSLRSLYEALCTSFLTQLSRASYPVILALIERLVLPAKLIKSVRNQEIPAPSSGRHVKVEGYWIRQGDLCEADVPTNYILTDCVRNNLRDLCRTVAMGTQPVLLQGHTSVGKTSMITYLAALTANKCVRINNHEHTDLQEYVGTYCADSSGKLVFQEGVLIDAMRRGYWIILDELNLAPTDVLEALNRLLDDNRQLYITETQTNICAHPGFRLFATQNPPGQYGGRKVLSRAFRNRFVELHFDDIPCDELITILHQRSQIPLSYAKKMTSVLKDLQVRRRCSDVFQGKQGFITLRDLFRWAERYRLADPQTVRFYDWDQHLADEGYIILAGRVRRQDECTVIAEILQKHFRCSVDEHNLFSLHDGTSPVTRPLLTHLEAHHCPDANLSHMVWTFCARRLYVLLAQAMRFLEPVLLVGETGCGKTSVCQFFAALQSLPLRTVNCHLHSESADFLGGLRPVRDRSDQCALFEWVDGPLVEAMRGGECFLADEISLADDSVLERLNSVLEPQRSLVLCEKASDHPDVILAAEKFRFVATMNPAGDHGKKELSPALRNRFTEIWCPPPRVSSDLYDIGMHNIVCKDASIVTKMVQFIEWFSSTDFGRHTTVSIRDLLAWVKFFNSVYSSGDFSVVQAYVHGAHLVFLDAIGCQTSVNLSDSAAITIARSSALRFISEQFATETSLTQFGLEWGEFVDDQSNFGYRPFLVPKSSVALDMSEKAVYAFSSPTTSVNLKRVLRALQLSKPIMLEGSPGVGKTSLVCALAAATGNAISRINLSEQTDISDLFGADLPVEGGVGGEFAWRDGSFLRALRRGDWVVLDEMNLASQSVLEGLNACFDHRGEVFVPELGRTFTIDNESTRVFACQNPAIEGGARKSLPKSFLNRFTQVFIEPLTSIDYEHIIVKLFPNLITSAWLRQMVQLCEEVTSAVNRKSIGRSGGPWEFNLRDLTRWCQIITKTNAHPLRHLHLFYIDRLRSTEDRRMVCEFVERVFGESYCRPPCHFSLSYTYLEVGSALLARSAHTDTDTSGLCVLQSQLPTMETLIHCVNHRWMAILVGGSGAGKTSLVRCLAALAGKQLQVVTMSPALDTTELLGGFEQADQRRSLETLVQQVRSVAWQRVRELLVSSADQALPDAACLLRQLENLSHLDDSPGDVVLSQTQIVDQFMVKCDAVAEVLNLLDDVGCMAEQLQLLRATVARDAGVNAGGVFEWVDSVLVRALAEGSWLLIDNVNLCPASVLDRLNGLLEPNGVLELSERGVVDGQVVSVVQHREFRLFLAMNPTHGEISRAMRNRGIEVFMEDISQHAGFDEDMRCLLAQRHIDGGNRSLSPLMELTRNLESTYRESGGSVIRRSLNSAELVSQLVCRQVSLPLALIESYTGEFVRSHSHLHSRSQLCHAIETCASRISDENLGSSNQTYREESDVSLSLTHLLWNPHFVLAKRLWSEISRHLAQDDLQAAVIFLKHSFLHCSNGAFELIRGFLIAYGNSLSDFIFGVECSWERPLALSVVPCNLWPGGDEGAVLDSCVDIVLVLVQFAVADKKALEASFDRSSTSKKNLQTHLSQLEYSIAINRSLMKLGERPLCLRLLWPVCVFIDQLLQNRPPSSLAGLKLWLEALHWRQRFYDVCCQRPDKSNVRAWVSIIGLHWQWLKEYLVSPILTEFPTALSVQRSLIADVDCYFAANNCQFTIMAEKFRQQLMTPLPLENSQIAESIHDLQQLSWAVDPYLHHKPADRLRLNSSSSLIHWLISGCGVSTRERMVEAFRILIGGAENSSVSEIRKHVRSALVSAGVVVGHCSTATEPLESSLGSPLSSVDLSVVHSVVKKLEIPFVTCFLELKRQHDYFVSLKHMIHYTCLSPEYIALRSAVSNGSDIHKLSLSSFLIQWIVSDPVSDRWSDFGSCNDVVDNADEIDAHIHSAQVSAVLTKILAGSQCHSNQLGLTIQQCFQTRQSLDFIKILLWKVRPLFFDESSYLGKLFCQWAIAVWNDFKRKLLSQLSDNGSANFADTVQNAKCVSEQYKHWLMETEQRISFIQSTQFNMGTVFVMLGVSQLFLLCHLPQVDPIQQSQLALEYSSKEISSIVRDLEVGQSVDRIATGLVAPSNTNLFDSPIVSVQKDRIKELQESLERNGPRKSTWRPPAAQYEELKNHVANFVSTVGGIDSLTELLRTVENVSNDDHTTLNFIAQQLKSRLISLSVFAGSLKSNFWAYPDLITPIFSAVQHIKLGVATLLSACRRSAKACRLPHCLIDIRSVILEFFSWVRYKPISVDCGQLSALVKTLAMFDDQQISGNWTLKLLEVAIADLSSRLVVTGSVDLSHVSDLVHKTSCLWTSQEQERQQRAEQNESLYKTKVYCDDSEQNEAQALTKMFPDFSEAYDESENETTSEASHVGCSAHPAAIAEMTTECLADTFHLASSTFDICANPSWCQAESAEVKDKTVVSFCLRYRFFSAISSHLSTFLEPQDDGEMSITHHMVIDSIISSFDVQKSDVAQMCNPYHDSNPSCVVACRSLLVELSSAVDSLLVQWSDNPALLQLRRSVQCVLDLDVASPLVKVTMGLEFILQKAQVWEEVAHKGISLSGILYKITDIVLKWRKLELDSWKSCLSSSADRFRRNAMLWMPKLHALFEESEKSQETVDQLSSALQSYLETSPLGEYCARLKLLLFFHKKLARAHCSKLGKRPSQIVCVTWNIYRYYSQFQHSVEQHIDSLRSPIEKKIVDFVKISRWNDVNFWAVKETVKRSHQFLHKQIKEFESVLDQTVSPLLCQSDSEHFESAQSHISIDYVGFLIENEREIRSCPFSGSCRLSRLDRITKVARRLCNKMYKQCDVMSAATPLNELVESICHSMNEFNSLNLEGIEEKQKRLKEAAHVRQCKRQALQELFRTLNCFGLSFRRGLVQWNSSSDIGVAMLSTPPLHRSDCCIMSDIKAGCDKYECRCISRFSFLRTSLTQPHKEVDSQYLERIPGFASDFLSSVVEQKKQIADSDRDVKVLSDILNAMQEICTDSEPLSFSMIPFNIDMVTRVSSLICDTIMLCHRFELFLSSVPDIAVNDDCPGISVSGAPALINRGRSSDDCIEMRKLIVEAKKGLISARSCLSSIFIDDQCLSSLKFRLTTKSSVRKVINDVTRLLTALRSEPSGIYLPFYDRFQEFFNKLNDVQSCLIESDAASSPVSDNTHEEVLIVKQCENIVGLIQLSLQEMKNCNLTTEWEEGSENCIFTTCSELHQLFRCLNVEKVIAHSRKLIRLLSQSVLSEKSRMKLVDTVYAFLPLLRQYEMACKHVLTNRLYFYRVSTKTASIIFRVFGEVLRKGFCTPPDLETSSDRENEGQVLDVSEGGIGEGEGSKDVSDKIESEDQLEGAHRPGEHEKEHNDDVKEEDKGIEMHDDFEGKMQDITKEELGSNDESEEEESDDLDKQMGDVDGVDEEKIDDRLWGDDEDEKEELDDADESGGTGNKDAQMEAKSDNEKYQKEPRKKTKVEENDYSEDEDQQRDDFHNNFPEKGAAPDLDIPDNMEVDGAEDNEGEESDDGSCPEDVERRPDYPSDEDIEETKEELDQEEAGDGNDETDAVDDGNEGKGVETQLEEDAEESNVKDSDDDLESQGNNDTAQEDENQMKSEKDRSGYGVQPIDDEVDVESAGVQHQSKPLKDAQESFGMAETLDGGREVSDGKFAVDRTEFTPKDFDKMNKHLRSTDSERTLAQEEDNAKLLNSAKTFDAAESQTAGDMDCDETGSDAFQHIKHISEKYDALVSDAATDYQLKEQQHSEEVQPDEEQSPLDDVEMIEDSTDNGTKLEKMETDNIQGPNKETSDITQNKGNKGDDISVPGDFVQTATVSRPLDAQLSMKSLSTDCGFVDGPSDSLRNILELHVDSWSKDVDSSSSEIERTWLQYETLVDPLARELSEQLRLILEPTQCSKLTGDYRTGKRLNMRKVIPYIASQFRKDKIWLRRSRPSKRDYQIVLAVDDSSSMSDNHSRQLAFETLALAGKAFGLVEAGRLAVVSFGEQTRLLCDLDRERSVSSFGSQLLRQLTFSQSRTNVADMLTNVHRLLNSRASASSGAVSQLLLVVSDGRGLFHEGEQTVRSAVRQVRHAGVFLLFIIIDSPESQSSVLDHRVVRFSSDGKVVGTDSYLDSFPFPYYMVLRNINSLPSVLSDALRQWFELVTSVDR